MLGLGIAQVKAPAALHFSRAKSDQAATNPSGCRSDGVELTLTKVTGRTRSAEW